MSSEHDDVDALPGDGACATAIGECTLRAAIQEANASPGEGIVDIPAGTYTISIPGGLEPTAAGGDLDVTDDLKIYGAGSGVTIIDGNGLDRVFDIPGLLTKPNRQVAISGLTVRKGSAVGGGGMFSGADLVLQDMEITDNLSVTGGGGGGGVLIGIGGSLQLTHSLISRNRTEFAGGGGILGSGTLTVTDTVLEGNSALVEGGAIDWIGDAQLKDTRVRNNLAGHDGGGILTGDGDLTIENSTFADNSAARGDGGGIQYLGNNTAYYRNADAGGKLKVVGTTINGNFAGRNGGGIFSEGVDGQICLGDDPPGCVQPSRVSLTNVTLSGNTAGGSGGGIYSYGEDRDGEIDACKPSLGECKDLSLVTLSSVTSMDNRAAEGNGIVSHGLSTVVMNSSLIGGAEGSGLCSGSGILISTGHNMAGDSSCSLNGPGDQEDVHVLLAPLTDNGGTTQTHALLAGSPAVDAGDSAACPANDQRGLARPQDGEGDGTAICDIGAFELEGIPVVSPSPAPSPAPTPVAGENAPPAAQRLPVAPPRSGGNPTEGGTSTGTAVALPLGLGALGAIIAASAVVSRRQR